MAIKLNSSGLDLVLICVWYNKVLSLYQGPQSYLHTLWGTSECMLTVNFPWGITWTDCQAHASFKWDSFEQYGDPWHQRLHDSFSTRLWWADWITATLYLLACHPALLTSSNWFKTLLLVYSEVFGSMTTLPWWWKINSIGWEFQNGSLSNWACWCTRRSMEKVQATSRNNAFQYVSTHTCPDIDQRTVATFLSHGPRRQHTASGPSVSLDQQPGILSRLIYEEPPP